MVSVHIVAVYACAATVWVLLSGNLAIFSGESGGPAQRFESIRDFLFIALTSVLLYSLLRLQGEQPLPAGKDGLIEQPALKSRRSVVLVLLGLAAFIPMMDLVVLRLGGPRLERAAADDLQMIAALRSEQLHRWIAEKRMDGRHIMENEGFLQRVSVAVGTGDRLNLYSTEQQLKGMQQIYGYSAVILMDVHGQIVLKAGHSDGRAAEALKLQATAFATQGVQMSELWESGDGYRYLDFVVPLFARSAAGASPLAIVVLQASPDMALFPMISQWPRSAQPGRIELVRGEGGKVVPLFKENLASGLAPSGISWVSDANLPAAVAIRSGAEGVVSGKDARGMEVLAAYGPITGTSWKLLAEMERHEILAPLYEMAIWISLIAALAIAACGTVLLRLWGGYRQVQQIQNQDDAVRMSECLYRIPFLGTAVIALPSGKFVEVNDRFCEMLGYSREELLDRDWKSVTPPEDVSAEFVSFDKILVEGHESCVFEKRYVHKSGSLLQVSQETRCMRMDAMGNGHVIAIIDDRTGERKLQQALLDSEENYRILADSGQVLIWRAGTDMRCMYFNRLWLDFTGRTLEQEAGEGWTEGVHPDDLARCLETYAAAFEKREAFSMEYRLRRYDGEYRWILDDGCPCYGRNGEFVGYIGNCLDITERRLTRKILAESESKLRAVVSNLPIILSTVSAEGVFTMSEGRALGKIGYAPGQLVGRQVMDFYSTKPEMLEAYNRACAGESVSARQSYAGVWFESFLQPFTDAKNEKGVMITCINITERVEAEDFLRMNISRMECLGRIAACRAASIRGMLDFALEEILGLTRSEFGCILLYDEAQKVFLPGSGTGQVLDACAVGASGGRYPLEESGFWADVVRRREAVINNACEVEDAVAKRAQEGQVSVRRRICVPVLQGEQIVAVLVVANREDLYTEKDAQQLGVLMAAVWNLVEQRSDRDALQRATNQLKVSQALAQVGGWEIGVPDRAIWWSEETFRIHELTPDSFQPTYENVLDFYTAESRRRLAAAVEKAFTSGIGFDLELGLVTAKGRTRQVHAACQAYRENGKVIRVIGAFQDITAYKRIERELREHQEHLEDLVLLRTRELVEARDAAERATKAKSAFLANMSHEIRTPINAVLGMSHLALRTSLTPKQREYLDKIMISANMLLGVINDILDFSKIEAGRLELSSLEFALGDVLDKVIAVTGQRAADKHLEFLVRVAPNTPEVLIGDPVRLGQVLTNLCSNAVKFTSSGEIMLSIGQVSSIQGEKVTLLFSVRDTGIGMSGEHMAQLFSPFFQGDASDTRRFGGTGLGLAICKQLVDMMGGHIWVSSELGRGSEFSLSVPFGLGVSRSRNEFRLAADLRGMHAIVIDQSVAGREVLTEMLQGFGWRVTSFEFAAEALETVRGDGQIAPDFMLVDWKQPEPEVAKLLDLARARKARCRLILMVVGGESSEPRFLASIGPDAEVFKPMTTSCLFDAVMTAFGRPASEHESGGFYRRHSATASPDGLLGAKVLLVEDNAFNQQVARELLESIGMTVVVAQNGKEAVDLSQTTRFDVVLMDVQMPVMDGLEATRRMRAIPSLNSMPILAMTAHAMVDEQHNCLEAGMDDFLSKPIEPPVLFAKLQQWIYGTAESVAGDAGRESGRPEPGKTGMLPDSLPGISISAGLHYCNDKEDFYLRMLREFMTSKQGEAVALRQKIEEGGGEPAVRMAHSMKSVAGAIGALDLSQIAARLEIALRASQAAQVSELLRSFEEALSQVIEGLRRELSEEPCDVGDAPISGADARQIVELVRQLVGAIHSDMGEAFELLAGLKKCIRGGVTGQQVVEIEAAMNVFDVDKTVSLLGELTGMLDCGKGES